MSIEPNTSTHLDGVLEGRLQNMDKQREIDLYYELLNSGHSVGEILNAVGPIRSKSKQGDTATSDHPQSEPDGVTNVASEAALVDAARADALCLPGLGVTEEAESCRTEKPQATQSPSLNRLGSYDGERLLGKSLPGSEPNIVGLAGANTSLSHGEAVRSESLERLEPSKDPSIARRVALLAVCTIAISSVSIAGFSIILGGRDAEPTATRFHSNIPSQTEVVAIPNPTAARSAAVVEALTPQKPAPSPSQKIVAGRQERVSVTGREAEAPQQSNADRPDAVRGSTDPATVLDNPAHGPTTLVAPSPSVIPPRLAETTSHSDAGTQDAGEPPEAIQKNGSKATATLPTGAVSAALPSQAHAVIRHKAIAPHQYAESRRRIHRQTAARYRKPMYYGRLPGSYYTGSDRGYSYGGPAPYSNIGG